MSRTLHCRVDPDLDRDIETYASAHGMTQSEAVRDLLRTALGMDATDRGYSEGKLEGIAEIKRRMYGHG